MAKEDTFRELQRVSRKMYKFYENGDLERWNKLVPVWTELYNRCDFGYRVGDKVRCPIANQRKIFTITAITSENTFILDDEVIVYGTLIEPYKSEPEQTTIFEFL